MYTITLKQNFPLRTVFAVSEKFGYVVSIFLEPLAGLCYHLHSLNEEIETELVVEQLAQGSTA